MNDTPKLLLAGMALLCIAGPTQVLGDDYKIYPGNMCQPYNGSQQSDLNHWRTGAANVGDSTLQVNCPIVRDNTWNTTGTKDVRVRFWDLSGTEGFCCQTYAYSGTANDYFVSARKCSSDEYGPQYIGRWSLSVPVSESVSQGYYFIRCDIPARTTTGISRVISYQVIEY